MMRFFIGLMLPKWNKMQFQAFAKPFFDRGKAWSFKAIERHIYVDKSGKPLGLMSCSKMKICRGSGVLVKVGNDWKITLCFS
jgi:hypothetical protein